MLDVHIMTQAQRHCLLSAARDLHQQFRGVFGEETIEEIRPIRDQIRDRVTDLLQRLTGQ